MKKNARRNATETHSSRASASPAKSRGKPNDAVPGSPKKGRQPPTETHEEGVTPTPARAAVKPSVGLPGSLTLTVDAIRAHHRERRFSMGIQQVLDRKLESFIRINFTDWNVGDGEAERDKANKEVVAKIKAARDGEGDPRIVTVVELTDKARAPADAERARHEKDMETLARSLPVAPWVETVPGLGYLGLATIIAETGDLKMYSNVAKVWRRLGYAPFDGLAGSSWKRQSWRNGRPALTAEEWMANPFSGRRYALIHTISVWLKNKQWVGASKTEDGVGKPNGIYGEVYARRRAHTSETHPDWSKQHSHMDALRVMMKEVLKDLYLEWNPEKKSPASVETRPTKPLPGSPTRNGRHSGDEAHYYSATASPAEAQLKPMAETPGSPSQRNGRQKNAEAQEAGATASPADKESKPRSLTPGSPSRGADRHA